MVDQDLINEMLARPEYADLPVDLVHEILGAVATAFGEEKLLTGEKKRQLKTEIARGNLQICRRGYTAPGK